ncbi:hypothetical protein GQR58_011219 [Nymphon striatum]|nr:hypothetical protein GQR58_011219 [Nymphon striatum]
MVRKPKYPLAQIIRRLSEQESATKPKTPCTSFKKKHCKGPVPVELNALKQFEEMQTENFVIKLTKGDNIFLIRDYVCEISNIVQYTDFVYVMFLVVEFTLCNSTSIIPQEWYNNGETWWPDYQNDHRIARAAMNREEPGQSWEKFDVRVLILTSYLTENYEKARIKLKEADSIDTADLQSEEDDMDKGRGKRKRTSSSAVPTMADFQNLKDINLKTYRVVDELKDEQKHMNDEIERLKLPLVDTEEMDTLGDVRLHEDLLVDGRHTRVRTGLEKSLKIGLSLKST